MFVFCNKYLISITILLFILQLIILEPRTLLWVPKKHSNSKAIKITNFHSSRCIRSNLDSSYITMWRKLRTKFEEILFLSFRKLYIQGDRVWMCGCPVPHAYEKSTRWMIDRVQPSLVGSVPLMDRGLEGVSPSEQWCLRHSCLHECKQCRHPYGDLAGISWVQTQLGVPLSLPLLVSSSTRQVSAQLYDTKELAHEYSMNSVLQHYRTPNMTSLHERLTLENF